jgi:hypothetical protein
LAEIFNERGEFRYAAMLYEQAADFEAAANSFDRAGETDRANYCRERLGSRAVKKIAQTHPKEPIVELKQFSPAPAKGNFFIETGSLKVESNTDEVSLLKKSWLFEEISDSELQAITSCFKIINVDTEGTVTSGAASSFLIFVVRGELVSDLGVRLSGDWLTPDLALSGSAPITWQAKSECRTLVMTSPDFDMVIGSNAGVLRKVFKNLTRAQVSGQDNYLKAKAI